MDRLRPLAFGLAGLVAAGLLWAAHGNTAEARLERARELVYERRPVEAAAEYQALLATLDPTKQRKLWVQAQAQLADLTFLELSDPHAAAELYRRLIAEAPETREGQVARERLADVARNHLGDVHEAIAQWEALSLLPRPDADRFAYKIAKAYFNLGEYEQCRQESLALAERFPGGKWTDAALFLAATAFQVEGRYDEAVEAFEAVETRFPETEIAVRARFQIGLTRASQRDWEGAMVSLLDALQTHPDPWRVQAEITRVRRHLAELRKIQPLDRTVALAR